MKRSEGKVLLFLPYILILVMVVLQVELIYPYNVVPVFSCLLFCVSTFQGVPSTAIASGGR